MNSVIDILNLLEIFLLHRHSQRMYTIGFKNNCANVLPPFYKNVRSYTQKHCKMCEGNIGKMLEILSNVTNNFHFKYQCSDFPEEVETIMIMKVANLFRGIFLHCVI